MNAENCLNIQGFDHFRLCLHKMKQVFLLFYDLNKVNLNCLKPFEKRRELASTFFFKYVIGLAIRRWNVSWRHEMVTISTQMMLVSVVPENIIQQL